MKIPNNYKRLESCSEEELIKMCIHQDRNEWKLMKIIRYRKRRAKDNQEEEIKKLKEENKKLKAELEIYKKQYKHTMWGDYIDEDLYDLDC